VASAQLRLALPQMPRAEARGASLEYWSAGVLVIHFFSLLQGSITPGPYTKIQLFCSLFAGTVFNIGCLFWTRVISQYKMNLP
jgi:hypothetical protein